MSHTNSVTATAWEAGSPINMARVVGYNNANITQASLASVSYLVRNKTTGVTIIVSTALTIGNVVFNTLQTDSIWSDAAGYNFKHQLSAAALPDGDTTYLAQYRLVDTSGNNIHLEFLLNTKEQFFD